VVLSGISPTFAGLFPPQGQITHVLRTRSPLYSRAEALFLARLACVKHAASVRSEPGSNSPLKVWSQEISSCFLLFLPASVRWFFFDRRKSYCLAFKELLSRKSLIGAYQSPVKGRGSSLSLTFFVSRAKTLRGTIYIKRRQEVVKIRERYLCHLSVHQSPCMFLNKGGVYAAREFNSGAIVT
jgi:hypothetical protein